MEAELLKTDPVSRLATDALQFMRELTAQVWDFRVYNCKTWYDHATNLRVFVPGSTL